MRLCVSLCDCQRGRDDKTNRKAQLTTRSLLRLTEDPTTGAIGQLHVPESRCGEKLHIATYICLDSGMCNISVVCEICCTRERPQRALAYSIHHHRDEACEKKKHSLWYGREYRRGRRNPAGWDVVPKARVLEAVRPNDGDGSGEEESFAYAVKPINQEGPLQHRSSAICQRPKATTSI